MRTRTKRQKAPEPPAYLESALSWPTEPEPMPVDTAKELNGKPFGTLYVGWWMNPYIATSAYGSIASCVGQGCCDTVHHSTHSTKVTSTQGIGKFYATKADALLACRWAVCRSFAKTLTQLDQLE